MKNRKEKTEWLEKKVHHLEEMIVKVTENLDETAESLIKDLNMLQHTIKVNSDKKLDKDVWNTLPTQEER